METPQYINISTNIVAGFNHNVATSIRLSVQSTGAGVIALNHSTTNLGYEILPNPANNGLIRYRYAPNSTTTVLGFDGPNMFINISYLTAEELSILNPENDIAGVNALINPISKGGVVTVNADSGSTRIEASVDEQQQGYIEFFQDDLAVPGTFINTSTVKTRVVIASTLEATNNVVLHPKNNVLISSVLNMGVDGNLYWNGGIIGYGNPGPGPIVVSSFDYLFTSTFQTSNVFIRGNNILQEGVLTADPDLNLLWNGQQVQTGTAADIFGSTISKAQITDLSTLRITVSTINGIYDQPSLPAIWLYAGDNGTTEDSPIYVSYDEQETFQAPDTNGIFNAGVNAINADPFTGQLFAVGNDQTSSYSTIQTSADGLNWEFITDNNPFATSVYATFYANNLWLIAGTVDPADQPQAPIIWSDDGINFNPAISFPPNAGNTAFDFAYDGVTYIATLETAGDPLTSIVWSTDGQTWDSIASGGFQVQAISVATDSKGMWVVTGDTGAPSSDNRIQWSIDGLNWNPANSIPSDFGLGYSVKYANGLWIIGGSGDNSLATILVSEDGMTWETQTSGNIAEVYKINFLDQVWYAAGTIDDAYGNNGLLSSTDGYNWHSPGETAFYTVAQNDICYLENVLVGEGYLNFGPSTTLYVTATVSSYTLNTNKADILLSNTVNAIISTLTVSTIISPTYVQVQNVAF